MKVRCEYCGDYMENTEERCPHCGAVNDNHLRAATSTPQTIEQLKDWYKARNLPPEETTRFFIGRDIKEPRAFGIYEENGQFIVYKNKADGTRAIRYKGTDEVYAVNELYLRLKEEILNQKNMNIQRRNSDRSNYRRKRTKNKTGIVLMSVILITAFLPMMIAILFNAITDSNLSRYNTLKSYQYYYTYDNELLYHGSSYSQEWWEYDFGNNEWGYYSGEFAEDIPLKLENRITESEIEVYGDGLAKINQDYNKNYEYKDLEIYSSRTYIDAGHHYEPSQSYYTWPQDPGLKAGALDHYPVKY